MTSDAPDKTNNRLNRSQEQGDPLLDVNNIVAGYGDTIVIEDVSLDVYETEVVALVGRNGAGKTTTLRSIAGNLIPESGTIEFNGADITHLDPVKTTQRGIVRVPEERRIFAGLTVQENLDIASIGAGDRRGWEIEDCLQLFPNLKGALSRNGSALSGGEQQMLAIARALVSGPQLLLLDEPTEGLAPQIVETVLDTLVKLKESGLTILLVEQNLQVATKLADYVFVLDRGSITFEGRVEEFESNEEMQERHLGVTTLNE